MAAEISTSTNLLSDSYSDSGKEQGQEIDLLGMSMPDTAESTGNVQRIELVKEADVDSNLYQKLWSSLEDGHMAVYPLSTLPSLTVLEAKLTEELIYARASGDLSDKLKCFLFAKVSVV